jgi:maleylacetoacetate isomerase
MESAGVNAMKLYSYYRSSASYRVRIALNLKGVAYEYAAVRLTPDGSGMEAYREINPQALVPTLEDNGRLIRQSLAICEYLEETHPNPPLIPRDPTGRARVRALALIIACEIHPLNNLRLLSYLTNTLKVSDAQRTEWYQHWIAEGFHAFEALLGESNETGRFCHGDTPGLADVFLVPQVYNAKRYNFDLSPFPTIQRINQACLALEAFERARPENQPDAK